MSAERSYIGIISMTDTPNLGLPFIEGSQGQKHITHNEALRILDAAIQIAVLDLTRTAPPASPAEGQRHVVAAAPTGAWAGQGLTIATWQDGAWIFLAPKPGWRIWSVADAAMKVFDGLVWRDLGTLALSGVIAPATITANQNNYAPAGLAAASVLQLSTDAARSVSGLGAGADGRVLCVINVGSQPLTLLDESASSGAANRFTLAGNLTLSGKQSVLLRYDGTAARWQAIAGSFGLRAANNLADVASAAAARSNLGVRDVLAAARTYYVRSDGNDANSGLSNSAVGAFLTIQKAVDTVCSLDMGIAQVTIQIADGSYAGPVALRRWLGALPPIIQGNNATPANVVVSSSSVAAIGNDGSPQWIVHDLKVTTTGGHGIYATNGGAIKFGNVEFGAVAQHQIKADNFGVILADGNFAVSGGAQSLAQGAGGQVIFNGRTVTFSGTVAYSAGTITTNRSGGNVDCYGMTFVNGGIVTGPRYTASGNGTVTVAGSASTYLPGNSAGSVATGGQYW
jgi:hypothetical protein